MRAFRRIASSVLIFCLLPLVTLAAPQAAKPAKKRSSGEPTWEEMKAKIENHWKNAAPNETILNIEKKGELEFTEERGTTTTLWDWGWAATIKGREGSYCRQLALVTIERPNKTRARFEIAALYKLAGGRWVFAELAVGEVEELPDADTPPFPSNDEAAKIFTEAWTKLRPDFEVDSIEVLRKPDFGRYKQNFSLGYKLAVTVTGTATGRSSWVGKKVKCTPETYSSVLTWDAEKKAWVADERMIRNLNETRDCELLE